MDRAEDQPSLFEDLPPSLSSDPEPPRRRSGRTIGRYVRLDVLQPDPKRLRQVVNEQALAAMAATVAREGIHAPLLVRSDPDGTLIIAKGHRRWAAARMVGLSEVPVVVLTTDDPEELKLVLALHQESLGAVDEAEALAALADSHEGRDGALAERLGIDPSRISRARRIAGLDDATKAMARERNLSTGVLAELAVRSLSDTDRARLLAMAPETLTREVVRAAARGKRQATRRAPAQLAHAYVLKALDLVCDTPSFTEAQIRAMTIGEFLERTGQADAG